MNNLSQILNDTTSKIDREMRRYLTLEERRYEYLMESLRYSAYEGGKRIRPFLTLTFAKALGGTEEAAFPYAIAVEMIHTYSLIHDDLPCMDNDDYRRGKPSNHKAFDEATALLAGDALLTYGLQIAAENREAKGTACEAVSLLAASAGFDGMIGGQMLDLMGEKERLSHDDFLMMNRLKTGCLIRAACLLGCLAAGYSHGTVLYDAAETYASAVGLAFQMEDDLLDAGTEDHKTTFLTFLSEKEIREEIASLTKQAINAVAPFDADGILTAFAEYLSSRTI